MDTLPGCVDLWLADDERIVGEPVLDRFRAMLDADEAAKQQRFVQARHRHQYLIAHGMLRTVLAGYLNVDPGTLRFGTNKFGKPSLLDPPRPLAFNLSHTDGLIVLAVAESGRLGVDVEAPARVMDSMDLANAHFSAAEIESLRRVPEAGRTARFIDLWTLKEAYVKGRGEGLSVPLAGFSFAVDGEDIVFQGPADDRRAWRFWRERPATGHTVAIAWLTDASSVAGPRLYDFTTLAASCPPS
ncbi:4'-phosphopantetheinyl transferase [Luteibacter rhizovicinus]|uniref:4'-phosphopantetheinyl transferase n=1 Tax=Luteibacter rhizovicinus TaxID=242606 RepID=A0A4R3YYA1_9GAMM|nr:4'-phosphopantetheinyl transferase superfamily protein [Luteibacter rhizovicinus]TCV97630.1 4'-phosphopantetheinyl transferase [Luteibacter rhizovicinus]